MLTKRAGSGSQRSPVTKLVVSFDAMCKFFVFILFVLRLITSARATKICEQPNRKRNCAKNTTMLHAEAGFETKLRQHPTQEHDFGIKMSGRSTRAHDVVPKWEDASHGRTISNATSGDVLRENTIENHNVRTFHLRAQFGDKIEKRFTFTRERFETKL